MRHLQPLKRGPKILREWLNRLRDYVIAQRIVRGIGYDVDERPGGSHLVLDLTALAAASSSRLPLQLIDASDGSPKGNIIFGTVKGFDVTPLATTIADGDHAWVELTVSYTAGTGSWSYDSVELAFGATVPDATATMMVLNLGYFTVDGDDVVAAFSALTGSQDARRCGTPDGYADFWGRQ